MNKLTKGLAGLTLFCILIYGMYWAFKTASYSLFYENMVIQTLHEEVKPECLLNIEI